MRLLQRLKMAFNPSSHSNTMSHYIPAIQYADSGVENSVWRSDLQKPVSDWRGNTGRVYNQQVYATQGPLLFANKLAIEAGLGGTASTYGQYITVPVAGFAGRGAQLDATSTAAEWQMVQQ